jgi:hypothetical protein
MAMTNLNQSRSARRAAPDNGGYVDVRNPDCRFASRCYRGEVRCRPTRRLSMNAGPNSSRLSCSMVVASMLLSVLFAQGRRRGRGHGP